ncbi:MAG: cobalamin B12-binding domain-containing protein [Chryseolinea sp.]
MRLFEPALRLSGTLWARGAIQVTDEHFITHHTVRLIRRVRRIFVPEQTSGPLALATGVAQESHLIGLRMVCDFLRTANWRIAWLPSTDRATVADEVRRLQPQAVLMSLGQDRGITPAQRLITDLRRRDYRGLAIVGGRIITQRPELVTEMGADLTAPNGVMLLRELKKRSIDR